MNGNKTLCSIKGCKHKASWFTVAPENNRQYRICMKHKHLIINPLRWERII